MDEQNRNLILAIVLSGLVMFTWTIFFPPPEPAPTTAETAQTQATPTAAGTSADSANAEASALAEPSVALVKDAPRISIKSERLAGSLSLAGGRIDDLKLLGYRETLATDSPDVTYFRPVTEDEAYFALFGWAPGAGLDFADVPGNDTLWTLDPTGAQELTPTSPVKLIWENGKGLTFRRTISLDENYLFTVEQTVENNSGTEVRLAPNNEIIRVGQPSDQKGFFILHEGAIRQSGTERTEIDWDDMPSMENDARWGKSAEAVQVQQNGWLGFTDHYWQAFLIPANEQSFESVLKYAASDDEYKAITRLSTLTVAPGTSATTTSRLFAGAKEWETIREYQNKGGIYEFLDTIDWGWFFFLTKPMFALLHWLHSVIGNMGWAIIALTLVIKAAVFPLAYKSYVSMAKMKELQPEMEKLKERAGDDRQKLQKETMELYRKEKVNPLSGCLPLLVQIPIFFSLYKVIFVTLELRHAPWFGWLKDLSAPDPSSLFNFFGLLPWDGPANGTILALIFIGILPILLGISMWLQQKLNPTPTEPTQAAVLAWMPWIFMFMLGGFASGLVIYWIANNTITFIQQYAIMTSHGARPDVFGNIRKSFQRPPKDEPKK